MGLFDRFKGKKTVNWSAAYTAEPKFYGRPDGTPFGAIALTEGAETVLPTAPQAAYQVDGQPVAAWFFAVAFLPLPRAGFTCVRSSAVNSKRSYKLNIGVFAIESSVPISMAVETFSTGSGSIIST